MDVIKEEDEPPSGSTQVQIVNNFFGTQVVNIACQCSVEKASRQHSPSFRSGILAALAWFGPLNEFQQFVSGYGPYIVDWIRSSFGY